MSAPTLPGWRPLSRLELRLDRLWWPLWALVLVALLSATIGTYEQLYPTAADRAALTGSLGSNPSLRSLYGPAFDLSTAGGFAAWRVYGYAALLAGFVGLSAAVRHTRVEEETGREELLRAGVMGRHTTLLTALGIATGWAAVVVALATASLVGQGLPAAGSFAMSLGVGATLVVFVGVGLVAAQLTAHARTARGIAGAVLAVAFLLRAAGDGSSATWLSWLSPIGWAQQVRPYAGERWWVFLLPVATTVVLVGCALVLEGRRDTGSGILAARLGPAHAGIGSASGFATRLQRATVSSWLLGMLVFAVVLGAIAPGVIQLVQDSPEGEDLLRRMGGAGSLLNTYIGALLPLLGAAGALLGVSIFSRMSAEESDGRTEQILATGVSRSRWYLAQLGVAVLGTVGLGVSIGLGLALGEWLADAQPLQVGDLVVAGLALAAPMLVVVALAALGSALGGVWSRLGWVAVGLCIALAWLGSALDLPDTVQDASPFRHLHGLPGSTPDWTTVGVLLAIAAVLSLAGLAAYGRRDLHGAN